MAAAQASIHTKSHASSWRRGVPDVLQNGIYNAVFGGIAQSHAPTRLYLSVLGPHQDCLID